VSETFCGLFPASSVMVMEAVLVPVAVGLNVTLIVQFAPAARLAPQVFVCEKSPLFVPLMAMPEPLKVSVAFPVFVNVTFCEALVVPTGWPVNVRLAEDKPTTGAIPVPDNKTLCGLPPALSVMVMLAARLPVAVGLKVTLMEQFAPAATLAPHVFVCEKSPLFVPVMAMLEIVNVAVPVLVSVTICTALLMPTIWLPKLMLLPPSVTMGATPVPVSVTVCGLPGNGSLTVMAPLRMPVAVGVKVTLTLQLAVGARVAGLTGQLLVWAKSPLAATLTVVAEAPLLLTLTASALLVVPTSWFPKVRLEGDTAIGGGV
jgi:hypothetical protein